MRALKLMAVCATAACASFALRLSMDQPTLTGDPLYYLLIAENIAAGRGMVVGTYNHLGELWAMFPPLYPFILGLLNLITALDPVSISLLNFAIDLLGAGALVWLGRTIGCKGPGIIAGCAYLLWPSAVMLSPVPHKEGLAAALAVAAAAASLNSRPILFGILSALLALTQPALVTLPMMFALVFLSWRVWPHALAAAIVVMAPWWIRNWLVFNRFVPLTNSGGLAFWVGVFGHGQWVPLPDHLKHYNEMDTSAAAGAEAWRTVSQRPFSYAIECVTRAVRVLANQPWLIGLLGGIWVRGDHLKLVGLCLAQLFVFQMWFELGTRHVFYMVPFLILLASEALYRLTRQRLRL